ncbi:TPA: hypothetical protein G9F28_004607 [Salmonella enterica]|nr:hypothetical protein [Salmonella enterica]HAF2460916.1 hypothetical protein [Salmonella enterica]
MTTTKKAKAAVLEHQRLSGAKITVVAGGSMASIKINPQQHSDLCEAFKLGGTHCQIATQFGISRERVRQILLLNGLRGVDGGRHVKIINREKIEAEKHVAKYGCTSEQLEALACHYTQKSKSPLHAFRAQRVHALSRGVEWSLIFWDWWQIWQASGKWELRGRGAGSFCMCRKGDEGAYEKNNVYIGSVVHNSTLGRTLAYERNKDRLFVHLVITAAGGPSAVAQHLGYSKHYINQLIARDVIPISWLKNGKAEQLSELTLGAFTYEQIITNSINFGGEM